jgi:histidyl-tRNA synthetase
LKYDLTIPFARYVAMNHQQLTFPFKRYQVQPVWRADRPQKGRYREFYQCDADVVGSYSLLNEIELVNIYLEVFSQLGMKNIEVKINHRKVLTALAELCGGIEKMNTIAIAIDKLDKIGLEKVKEELVKKEFSTEQLLLIERYLSISGSNNEKLSQIKNLLINSEIGKKGIEELEFVINSSHITKDSGPAIDFTLARGLNYYTGIIFEVQAPPEVKMGSIGGGGRYDDLTGLFGVPDIPGVGISFGVDRIYDVMEELSLFPDQVYSGTKVLFFNSGENESKVAFQLMQQLRDHKISAEIFHEPEKTAKQFKYAEKKKIPYVVIIESDDLKNDTCTIKNIVTGVKQSISQKELLSFKF